MLHIQPFQVHVIIIQLHFYHFIRTF